MTYYYYCPVCARTRKLVNIPEIHKDLAAPYCWEHEDGIKMRRLKK